MVGPPLSAKAVAAMVSAQGVRDGSAKVSATAAMAQGRAGAGERGPHRALGGVPRSRSSRGRPFSGASFGVCCATRPRRCVINAFFYAFSFVFCYCLQPAAGLDRAGGQGA